MGNMFAKNLKYLIDSGKISVKTILNITSVKSKSLVYMWKTGERQITTDDAIKLANFLNITIDDLINKDLSQVDEFDSFYNANRHLLTEEDKEMIRFIIEKRAKK